MNKNQAERELLFLISRNKTLSLMLGCIFSLGLTIELSTKENLQH